MGLVLLIILIVLCLGGLPPVSGLWHDFGYGPSGLLGVLIVIVLILVLTGRL